MKRLMYIAIAIGIVGCASIAGGGSSQNVMLNASPSPATYVVKSSSGLQLAQGTVGGAVRLPRKNEYQVEITAPGYQTQSVGIVKGVNGWFWANLLLGGVVGMAIDAASGAMYKLEPSVINVTLVKSTNDNGEEELCSRMELYDAKGRKIGEKLTKFVR